MRLSQSAQNVVGMLFCGTAAFIFALVAVLVKLTPWPKAMILEVRSLFQLFFCAITTVLFAPKGNQILGDPSVRKYLLVRSVMYWAFIILYWTCLDYLDVGDATTFVYSEPIFAGLIGMFWLGESCNWSFFLFSGLNIAGLILVCKPPFLFGSSQSISATGVAFALSAALAGGVLAPLIRKSKSAHWTTVEIYSHFASGLVLTPSLLVVQETALGGLDLDGPIPWTHLLIISVLGFLGLACLTVGYQYAEASVGSLLMYLEIPLSYGLQYFVFGKAADTPAFLGCGLIIGSGFLSIAYEFNKAKKEKVLDEERIPLLISQTSPKRDSF